MNLRWSVAAWTTLGFSILVAALGSRTICALPPTTINSVTVTPNPAIAVIGSTVQFTATVTGTGSFSNTVTWSLAPSADSNLSPGTLSANGLYTTPYPAPATVTVMATSIQDATKSGSVTVTLKPPPAGSGPALTVDAGNQTHAISPYIYGMNAAALDTAAAANANITVVRWGGNTTSRYNYQTNTTNREFRHYFENGTGLPGTWPKGSFDDLVMIAPSYGIKVMGTMPVIGWVSNSDTAACSFPISIFPDQQKYDGLCGDGVYPKGVHGCTDRQGCRLRGNDTVASTTSIPAPPPAPPSASAVTKSWADNSWAGGWVEYLVNKFGPGNPSNGAGKGVAIYSLDNEPHLWNRTHADVHPNPYTYDEVTNGGIGTALAIKAIDPTAEVSGPVLGSWLHFFYSSKDFESGLSTGSKCRDSSGGTSTTYQPYSNPVDRKAHGGVPIVEYYLQQFAAAETTYGKRLLDYLDMHIYFAARYPADSSHSVGLAPAGDTGAQQARLDSTRVFWDSTYTTPLYPQPNYSTDSNYTSLCNVPLQAPAVIPMMQSWVERDYPGTKTAITEYNWGGMESINGAVAQADILGIFGKYGLNLATLFPGTNSHLGPGTMAFEMYRNYDGNKSTFGNMALASTSANQGQLSVYGALRTSDGMVTVMVLNKTYGELNATISLENLAPKGMAQVFRYSNAHLSGIVAQPNITVMPPATGSTTSTITAIFPAQSITLFVVPRHS